MKKKKLTITSVLYYLLITVEAIILVSSIYSKVSDQTPTFFGYSAYIIVTPSMSGVLEVGDVIITHDIENAEDINVGDIVTYRGESGSYKDKDITHEVIKRRVDDDGNYYFTTKGVSNNAEDPEISENQLVSKFIYKSYVLTFLYGILTTIYGFILLVVVPIIYIIINEVIAIFKEAKEEKKDEKTVH